MGTSARKDEVAQRCHRPRDVHSRYPSSDLPNLVDAVRNEVGEGSRKSVARLYFNGKSKKHLGVFDSEKVETRLVESGNRRQRGPDDARATCAA
jgi:hypothetical protein